MGEAARKLLDQALGLPAEERELLALDLLASLQNEDRRWEEAWSAEIERRLADVREGRVETVAWDVIHRDLLARFGPR